ncbi:FtsX-like permease family protein [Nonomuraea dietziae]|uniref:FtsX-like permease family protein n=1 Tax=Nonomuraea dietziae TaxID=65515 RepID=UPI0031E0DF78
MLALIGLANLLTASALGLRDHALDLAVLKAMGLTRAQVMATLVTGTGVLVVLGVVLGTAAGSFVVTSLIDLHGPHQRRGRGHRQAALGPDADRGLSPRQWARRPRGGAASSAPPSGCSRAPRPAGNTTASVRNQ